MIRKLAAYVILGINTEGKKEVLTISVGDNEKMCIRDRYRKISDAVITFSRGWMAVHNPASDNPVTDALTTMEFSIAMLACRDWSNREIAEHMGVSLNTVKHYLTDIFNKLHVKKRDELKNFVLK